MMLVGGLTFASLLMTQQCGVFFGLLSLDNESHAQYARFHMGGGPESGADVNEIKPMRDTRCKTACAA